MPALSALQPFRHEGLQSFGGLAIESELGAAVFLPARLGFFSAELLFFTVADDTNAGRSNSSREQCSAGRVSPVLAECQVVFGRAALVGIATDENLDGRMGGQV